MQLIRISQQLTFCCPGTSSDSSPTVCRIRFSILSLRYRLLSFCYVMDDMESGSQGQCSAKHNGTTRIDHHYMPLYTAFLSGCTTPKYLTPALLTPSHPHPSDPLTPHTLITLSDPAAALPDATRSFHHYSIESLITAQPREERVQSPSVPCLKT